MQTTGGVPFVGPNAGVIITDSYAADFGVGVWSINTPLDFEAFTSTPGGVEVFVEGTGWVLADETDYDPETPDVFYALWSAVDLAGRPWRLTSPVSGWTAGGNVLAPSTGTFGSPPPGARAIAEPVRKMAP